MNSADAGPRPHGGAPRPSRRVLVAQSAAARMRQRTVLLAPRSCNHRTIAGDSRSLPPNRARDPRNSARCAATTSVRHLADTATMPQLCRRTAHAPRAFALTLALTAATACSKGERAAEAPPPVQSTPRTLAARVPRPTSLPTARGTVLAVDTAPAGNAPGRRTYLLRLHPSPRWHATRARATAASETVIHRRDGALGTPADIAVGDRVSVWASGWSLSSIPGFSADTLVVEPPTR